jgi:hypothetical protein
MDRDQMNESKSATSKFCSTSAFPLPPQETAQVNRDRRRLPHDCLIMTEETALNGFKFWPRLLL